MKNKILLLVCVSVCFYNLKAQMIFSSGNNFVQTGGYVVLQDASLVNNGTFNPSAGTVRFSGTGNNSISGNTSPAFHILEINKSSGSQLTLQNNISVNNSINFLSGLIDLNNNNIVLNGSAYLNNESETGRITGITGGYVQATATLNVPSSENPGNLGIIITSAQNPGVTVIRRGHVSQQNSLSTGNSIYRYYDILPATPPSSLTVRLNYFDAELNGLNESNLAIWKSNDTLHWSLQGYTSRDASANFVEYNSISGYTQRWTLSTIDNVLPLGLLSFGVKCQTNSVNLKWTTATNTNSSVFEVQRSSDGLHWQSIVTIPAGAGNEYNYTDLAGRSSSLYRLKLSGTNNTITYSSIKSSGCALTNTNTTIYPVPATSYVVLQLNNMPDKELLLTLYNNSGQILMKKNISITANVDTYTLPIAGLPAGVYHVSVQSPGYKKTLSFTKE